MASPLSQTPSLGDARLPGVLSISLDFELIWGTIDRPNWRRMQPLCQTESQEVIGRLLQLFDRYSMPATWATVGHLFLDQCSRDGAHAHPELDPNGTDPRFREDPCSNESQAPIYYGRKLVQQILACPTRQEIGSHTFSHADFSTCTRQRAHAELSASVKAAADLGIQMTSFVFPRNRVGHLDLLPQYGFRVFRGPGRTWHEQAGRRQWYHRAGHMADIMCALPPSTVTPEWTENRLWDIPGSMLFTPSHGMRRFIPMKLRVERALKGLRNAARDGRIFHFWFHPTDLVVRQNDMFDALRQILEAAAEMRACGKLAVVPMGEIPAYAVRTAEGSSYDRRKTARTAGVLAGSRA